MPPIISISGKSKSGKTTLIVGLVSELNSRGYRVATIKHTMHREVIDVQGKDSWRHIQAGSKATAISSPEGIVLVKPTTHDPSPEEVARLLDQECDIVIAEGFKQGNTPKIGVHRKRAGAPLSDLKNLTAMATDEPIQSSTRQFALNDIKSLADLIENEFIRPQREQICIFADNVILKPGSIPEEIIANTLMAMISGIKGRGRIEKVQISLRRARS